MIIVGCSVSRSEVARIGNSWRAKSFVASTLLQSVDADSWIHFYVLELCVTFFLFGFFFSCYSS